MKNQRELSGKGRERKGTGVSWEGTPRSPFPLMGLGSGVRGSHSEFAVTQLLVDLPTKFGHVLLGEAEWLRQGQMLAILGVNKAGHEKPPCQDLCYTFHMRCVSIFQRTCPLHIQRESGSHSLGFKNSLTLKLMFLLGT